MRAILTVAYISFASMTNHRIDAIKSRKESDMFNKQNTIVENRTIKTKRGRIMFYQYTMMGIIIRKHTNTAIRVLS